MQEPTGRPVWVDGHPTDRDAVVRSLAINRLRPFRHIVLINAHSHPDHFVHSGELDSPEKEGEYMGLFRRDDDGGRRFVMREKLVSIGDDFWIRDDDGNKVYKVNGKALRVRKTLVLEDESGNELVHIQDRVLNLRGTMKLERDGEGLATVHKALIGIRDRYEIDVENGEDLKAKGNVLAHEYEVKRNGDVIATVTRKWVRTRETTGSRSPRVRMSRFCSPSP